MALKTLKMNGVCSDIGKLTNVNFHYLHTHEDIHIPFTCRRDCPSKYHPDQPGMCRKLLNIIGQKTCYTKTIEICAFKCGLVKLVFPIYDKDKFCGVVISDEIVKKTSRPHPFVTQDALPALDINQITSLASILNTNRPAMQDEVTSNRRLFPISRNQALINDAQEFIKRNYYNPRLSLRMLADEIHISYFHLCRLFKQELNLSFVEYLTLVRLKRTIRLLDNFKLTISQVAYASGFSEYHYFSRIFKKYFRCSPSDFRRLRSDRKNALKNKVLSALNAC